MGMPRIMRSRKKRSKRMKRKQKRLLNFKMVVARKSLKKNTKKGRVAIKSALLGARRVVKKRGGKSKFKVPKILAIPQTIGAGLPLISILAGFSALGALTNGVTGIAKAINESKFAKNQLEKANRHNKVMESIVMGK